MSDRTSRISLLCTGDLHLGRFPTRVPPDVRELSVEHVWKQIVSEAIHRRVDALVLTGDVADRQNAFFQGVDREDLIRGFQVSKNKYVQLTEEELDSVEAEANRNIELKQFVPVESVDPIYLDSSYYLGPEKGGEKPYRLLTNALEKRKRVAVAQLVSRGKEELVLIRPYQNGLIMHTAYYADEIRDFEQIPKGDSARLKAEELKLSQGLIERLSEDDFKPDHFEDEYRLRVLGMLKEKRKGEEITIAPEPERKRPAATIDLMQALKRSMERVPARSKPARSKPAARKRRQKAS
jgi:DNA end-binding protein Ku